MPFKIPGRFLGRRRPDLRPADTAALPTQQRDMIDSDQMLLQFTMNLSTDPRLRTVTSGDNSIEVPEVDSRIFSQRVRLRSGQTLILSGFEQNVDRGSRSGMFSPSNWLTGGGGSTNNRREVVVILITPIVLDDDSEIHDAAGAAGDFHARAS